MQPTSNCWKGIWAGNEVKSPARKVRNFHCKSKFYAILRKFSENISFSCILQDLRLKYGHHPLQKLKKAVTWVQHALNQRWIWACAIAGVDRPWPTSKHSLDTPLHRSQVQHKLRGQHVVSSQCTALRAQSVSQMKKWTQLVKLSLESRENLRP